jgi:hypothetical protein
MERRHGSIRACGFDEAAVAECDSLVAEVMSSGSIASGNAIAAANRKIGAEVECIVDANDGDD